MIMTIFGILGYVILAFWLIVFLIAAVVIAQYLCTFHYHKCKNCGKTMEYKGIDETADDSLFIFYCKHCGHWERIPKVELYCNNDDNETTAA